MPNIMGSKFMVDAVEDETDNILITKTGNKKSILGYDAKEFNVTSDEGESLVWITKDIQSNMSNMFGQSFSEKKNNSSQKILEALKGSMLEMNYVDNKNEKRNMHMIGQEIINNPDPIINADYEWSN